MATCGHQFANSADDDGWFLSSSAAAPVRGNNESHLLLHRIMSELQLSNHVDFLQSRRITLAVAKDREVKLRKHREDRKILRQKTDSFHDFSNFDETEHFDGCPVKWLFRRQSTESWRSTVSKTGEEKTVRDKIPKEIQIRKMGLKTRKGKKNSTDGRDVKATSTVSEEKRAKLAAKLNFRPFYENNDSDDISDDESTNFFLRDRRPWLWVLLAPRDVKLTPQSAKPAGKERDRSPTMSVRSLTLPEIVKPRPKTTPLSSSAQRWAGKKQPKDTKTLMIIPTNPDANHFIRIRRYETRKGSKNSMQVVSNRVQFSERPGKPMR